MNVKRRWTTAWLDRILANAFAGGLEFARTGTWCGFAAGALSGFLLSGFDTAVLGALLGGAVGVCSGLTGALVYAVAAARAKPGPRLQPFVGLRERIAFGQFLGTLGACSAFVAFEITTAHSRAQPLDDVGDSLIFMFVAPALMILGAIAAAILGREINR